MLKSISLAQCQTGSSLPLPFTETVGVFELLALLLMSDGIATAEAAKASEIAAVFILMIVNVKKRLKVRSNRGLKKSEKATREMRQVLLRSFMVRTTQKRVRLFDRGQVRRNAG